MNEPRIPVYPRGYIMEIRHYVSGAFFTATFFLAKYNVWFGIISLTMAGVAYWASGSKKREKESLQS